MMFLPNITLSWPMSYFDTLVVHVKLRGLNFRLIYYIYVYCIMYINMASTLQDLSKLRGKNNNNNLSGNK